MALDPYYNNVSLLLPMEGANGQDIVTDWSPSPKTLVPTAATISTAQSKWGQGSGYSDGSSGVITTTDALPASGNITVEFWAYPTSNKVGGVVLAKYVSGSPTRFYFAVSSNAMHFWLAGNAEPSVYVGSVPSNQWSHLRFVVLSGVMYFCLNGAQIYSTAMTQAFATSNYQLLRYNTASESFQGYLQDLRVTKAAREIDNFTPPGRLLTPELYGAKYLHRGTLPTLKTVTGNCIVSGNGGAQEVIIREAATRLLVATATPNATTGDWTASVPPGDYDITYFAPDCQPICHGPYTVTA